MSDDEDLIPVNKDDVFNQTTPKSLSELESTLCPNCGVLVPAEGDFICPSSDPDSCPVETYYEFDVDEIQELMFDD